MKLWDYDPETLLPNLPTMVTFPNLDRFYKDWCADLRSKGVDVQLNTDVTAVPARKDAGVVLNTAPFDPEKRGRGSDCTVPAITTETYDELVLAVLADEANNLLGRTAT